MILWPQDGSNYMTWHVRLDLPHTAAQGWSCPPPSPFPFKNHLEVPVCFCITLQTSPPTMWLQGLILQSLNFPPVFPAHVTPTKGLPFWVLTNPSPLCAWATADPSPGTPPPVNTSIQVLPISQGCLHSSCKCPFFSYTNQFIMTTFLIALDPVSHLRIWLWASWLWSHIFYSSVVSQAPKQNT